MESNPTQSYLNTFLEVSKYCICLKDSQIKKLAKKKFFINGDKKREINAEIEILTDEKNEILGKLDSVRLEMLDFILDNPLLISERFLKSKKYNSVIQFVQDKESEILERGLYKKYPCSIAEVLNIGLSAVEDNVNTSLFDRKEPEFSDNAAKNFKPNNKVIKKMIKNL